MPKISNAGARTAPAGAPKESELEMYLLTVALGNVSWQLMFAEEENAALAHNKLASTATGGDPISLEDDFGQKLTARRMSVSGWLYEDMDKSALARIELALHASRTQIKGNQIAENDPVLKQARARQNMAVLSPMGPGVGLPGFNGRG